MDPGLWTRPTREEASGGEAGGDAFVDFVLVEVVDVRFRPVQGDMGVGDIRDFQVHRRRRQVLDGVVDGDVEVVGVGVDFDGSAVAVRVPFRALGICVIRRAFQGLT